MDWQIVNSIATVALYVLILGVWKPWTRAYADEKGKNFARKEDIDKILTEVTAVTRTQEEIKTELTGDLWYRQTIWQEKKLVYANLLTVVHNLAENAQIMKSVLEMQNNPTFAEAQAKLEQKRNEALVQFTTAEKELIRHISLAAIFTNDTFTKNLMSTLAIRREPGWDSSPQELGTTFVRLLNLNAAIIHFAQRDLGIKVDIPSPT